MSNSYQGPGVCKTGEKCKLRLQKRYAQLKGRDVSPDDGALAYDCHDRLRRQHYYWFTVGGNFMTHVSACCRHKAKAIGWGKWLNSR